MSRKSEKRTETRETEVTTEVRCDLCGRVAPTPGLFRPWANGSYDATETEVKLRTGSSFPEGGDGEEVEFDVCPDCFRDKLIPWFRAQGAEPRASEWEF